MKMKLDDVKVSSSMKNRFTNFTFDFVVMSGKNKGHSFSVSVGDATQFFKDTGGQVKFAEWVENHEFEELPVNNVDLWAYLLMDEYENELRKSKRYCAWL